MIRFSSLKAPILWGLFSLLFIAVSVQQINLLERGKELIAPPPQLERFTFGYRYLMADSLWVRAIQDFDYCEKELAKHLCQGNGWLYKMLDSVTTLSPDFYNAYAFGAIVLSVIVSDIQGATKLFDKGVEVYPNRWVLLYRAAYHAIYEEKDEAKAARLFERAVRSGAPAWLKVLSARLYSETGRREIAEHMLQEMIEEKADPALIAQLKRRLGLAP